VSVLDSSLKRSTYTTVSTLEDHGVAIVDCETTGLFPQTGHRIIELAVIHLGREGVENEWHTLLNPERDIGASDVHGIRAADVVDAPRFQDIVGEVLGLLSGRVVVAHNLRFDRVFLEAELGRVGYDVGPLPGLCTIALSQAGGVRASRLADCCRELGVEPGRSHRALDDAKACAWLFQALDERLAIRKRPLDELGCNPPLPELPAFPASASLRPRTDGRQRPRDSFLSRLVRERSAIATSSGDVTAYLDLLDRALEDRRLSDGEREDLRRAAELYGLSGDDLRSAHGRYFDALCAAALADHTITERERYDLELVAGLLGIDDLDARLKAARATAAVAREPARFESLAGKSVCFTGKLECTIDGEPVTRDRAEELARAVGFEVRKSVTKSLDILVVADPHTSSGKAKKARQYGTRIIAETAFWPLIGVTVD